jgi:hypothetical protein
MTGFVPEPAGLTAGDGGRCAGVASVALLPVGRVA